MAYPARDTLPRLPGGKKRPENTDGNMTGISPGLGGLGPEWAVPPDHAHTLYGNVEKSPFSVFRPHQIFSVPEGT